MPVKIADMQDTYDVIVVGGGPAGSAISRMLADYGHSVLVLERAKFPRHHIGESLIPHTYWILKRIGMLEKMKKSSFVVKESVQFISASGRESAPFFFPDRDPNEWSRTWQVDRHKFDTMLLENAREHGVEVHERVNVREVLFENDRAVGVRAIIDGQPREIRAKVTVDATGQIGLLSRQ